MTGSRSRTEWSSPNIVLTIVLALLAAQQAYFNFNGSTQAEIGRNRLAICQLQVRVAALENRAPPDCH